MLYVRLCPTAKRYALASSSAAPGAALLGAPIKMTYTSTRLLDRSLLCEPDVATYVWIRRISGVQTRVLADWHEELSPYDRPRKTHLAYLQPSTEQRYQCSLGVFWGLTTTDNLALALEP